MAENIKSIKKSGVKIAAKMDKSAKPNTFEDPTLVKKSDKKSSDKKKKGDKKVSKKDKNKNS